MGTTKILLFDIDGTLLKTGYAGNRSLNRAFVDLYGIGNATEDIRPDGKTDPLIIREMLANKRPDLDPEPEISKIIEIYLKYLKEEIFNSPGFTLMPGVKKLLERLSGSSNVVLGVATGNIEASAWIKLTRAGLDSYFHFGGYGSDSENRTDLIRAAIGRAEAYLGELFTLKQVSVIGDTPRDIIHGKAVGVNTVAVATGRYGVEELLEYCPDHVFVDFADTSKVAAFLG